MFRYWCLGLVGLAWLGTGCSDDPGAQQTGGAAGTGGGGASSGGSSSVSGSPAGGGMGGTGSGGAATGGGGAAAVAPLVPLITGHVSTFAFSALDSGAPMRNTCEAPRAEVGAVTAIDGHSGVLYTSPCADDPFLLEGSGDQLTAYRLEGGKTTTSYEYVHTPVKDGESWTTGNISYQWRSVPGTLETPAGDLTDCWERRAADLVLTYCRGIGLAAMRSTLDNYALELISKNF